MDAQDEIAEVARNKQFSRFSFGRACKGLMLSLTIGVEGCADLHDVRIKTIDCHSGHPLADIQIEGYIVPSYTMAAALAANSDLPEKFEGNTDGNGDFEFQVADGVPYRIEFSDPQFEYRGVQRSWVYSEFADGDGTLLICLARITSAD